MVKTGNNTWNVNARTVGIFTGYFLSFIAFFLPWYNVSVYGNLISYTGVTLTSQFPSLWLLYLIPLVGGMGVLGALLHCANRSDIAHQSVISMAFSIIIIAVAFLALLLVPEGYHTPIMDSLGIGGYTAITGGILSLILSIFK